MLQLQIHGGRLFNEQTEEFVVVKPATIRLEHSLISIQKWESKWHKSYLSLDHPRAEVLDYVRCMAIDSNVDPNFPLALTPLEIIQIKQYMDDPMTATTFSSLKRERPKKKTITAEVIYYWMTLFDIPFECAKWHINQLLTLIKVCSIESHPPKMSKKEAGAQRSALNRARRAKMGSSG